jgi:cell division protein FtsB
MSRHRRVGRLVGALVGTLVVVAALLIGVFPTRTYVAQRTSTHRAQERLAVLSAENKSLAQRIQGLNADSEIERIAREQYNLVMPGEEAYAVLPAPQAPIELPAIWPFGQLGAPAGNSSTDPATNAEG